MFNKKIPYKNQKIIQDNIPEVKNNPPKDPQNGQGDSTLEIKLRFLGFLKFLYWIGYRQNIIFFKNTDRSAQPYLGIDPSNGLPVCNS